MVVSWGCFRSKTPDAWWDGPLRLPYSNEWPNQPVIEPSLESQKETKLITEIVASTVY